MQLDRAGSDAQETQQGRRSECSGCSRAFDAQIDERGRHNHQLNRHGRLVEARGAPDCHPQLGFELGLAGIRRQVERVEARRGRR